MDIGNTVLNWNLNKNVKQETQGKMNWLGLGLGALGQGINAIGQKKRYDRSVKDQERFMNMQMKNQMKLNEQAQALGIKTWEQTNAKAQMEQLREAGLNPALMYGQSGPGGTTSGPGGGGASGGNAPAPQMMELGVMQQMAKLASEIKVNEATAENLEAQADSTRGAEGTVGAADIESKLAGALNSRAMAEVNSIAAEIGRATTPDQIDRAHYEVEGLIKQNKLTDEQANLVREKALTEGVQRQLMRSGIEVNEQKAKQIVESVKQDWEKVAQGYEQLIIGNQANKLRGIEGKTDLQRVKNDFILGALGKEIDLMKLNVEQQKIFTSLFNGVLGATR